MTSGVSQIAGALCQSWRPRLPLLLSSTLSLQTFILLCLVTFWMPLSLQLVFRGCRGALLSWPAMVLKASGAVWIAECLTTAMAQLLPVTGLS